jgi:hypothetical protein
MTAPDAARSALTGAGAGTYLRVNGHTHRFEAPVGRTLAETLRDDLGLTGTKVACGEGHCGACTVQLDGVPVLSCITLVHTVGERVLLDECPDLLVAALDLLLRLDQARHVRIASSMRG